MIFVYGILDEKKFNIKERVNNFHIITELYKKLSAKVIRTQFLALAIEILRQLHRACVMYSDLVTFTSFLVGGFEEDVVGAVQIVRHVETFGSVITC